MADADLIGRKRPRRDGDAWSVSELAEHWRTGPRQIYDLIDLGLIKTFSISRCGLAAAANDDSTPKRVRDRGTRITDAERLRWERESGQGGPPTETATLPSDGEERIPSPNTAILSVVAASAGG